MNLKSIIISTVLVLSLSSPVLADPIHLDLIGGYNNTTPIRNGFSEMAEFTLIPQSKFSFMGDLGIGQMYGVHSNVGLANRYSYTMYSISTNYALNDKIMLGASYGVYPTIDNNNFGNLRTYHSFGFNARFHVF